ncbi:O-antigen ligase family protein [Paenibacillus sp.]|uniref:O-antigen ligase family protein n=1 Tax=Paenibacillus sp. TaxID=58172 RepID=UPI002811DE2B|nr:O-antigen ligase family protein [Paenibacillus sp.]
MQLQSNQKIIRQGTDSGGFLFWTVAIGAFCFLIFAPFSRGLFNGTQSSFDSSIFAAQIAVALTTMFLSLRLFKLDTAIRSLSLVHILWLIPLSYLLSLFGAASVYSAMYSLWISILYTFVVYIGAVTANGNFGSRLLSIGILISSSIIVLFGLMNWFGDASFWGLFNWSEVDGQVSKTYRDAVLIDSNGERLTSVFQYANSYAAYLLAVILAVLVIMVGAKNRFFIASTALLLVPALLSLVLTLSRGGLVVFPIILVLVLPFLKFSRQILFIVHLILSGITVLLILNPVTELGLELQNNFSSGTALQAWSIVIAGSVTSGALSFVIQRFLSVKVEGRLAAFDDKKMTMLVLPLAAVIVGALGLYLLLGNTGFVKMLPDNIQTRVENINLNQHSVLERGTFYQDAIKLWKDYPVFGAGGGAWQTLYEKYQNNPYTSRQAHNFYLQTLVEVGIVGLLSLLLVIGAVLYHFLRSYWKKPEEDRYPYLVFYIFAAAILIHSFIDFNMSYVYLGAIVFLCLGGMLASNELSPYAWQEKMAKSKARYIYPSALVIGAAVFLFVSISNLSSNNQYNFARDGAFGGKPLDEYYDELNSAIGKLKHPEYVDLKLQILNSLYNQSNNEQYAQEAEKLLSEMKEREPYYKTFVYRELQLRSAQGQFEAAVELLEKSIPNYPWDIELYEQLATTHFIIGLNSLQAGQPDAANAAWNEVASLLARVNEKAAYLDTLPEAQLQGRAFGLTPGLALPLGQIAYYRGDYAQAEQYLSMRLDPNYDDAYDSEATLYYAATLTKQGKGDDGLIAELLVRFPDNQEQLTGKLEAILSQPVIGQ